MGYHLIARLIFVFILIFAAGSVFAQSDEYPSIQAVLDLPRCSTLAVTNETEPMRQVASGGATEYIWDDDWTQQTQYDLLVVPVTTRNTIPDPSPRWRFLYSLRLSNGNLVHFGMRGQTAAHVPPELLADGKRVTPKTITEATHITGGATTVTAGAPGVYNVMVVRVENGQHCRSDLMWLNVGDMPPAGEVPAQPMQPSVVVSTPSVPVGTPTPPPCVYAMTGSPFTGLAASIPGPNFVATTCSDTVYGNALANGINGDDGNDTIYGYDGDDRLGGEDGNDVLEGGTGNDLLRGERGNDTLRGQDGDDNLYGDQGDDLLEGGNGNDDLRGDLGNDTLNGGDGNDLLSGLNGSDILNGGDGNDGLAGDRDNDILNGGAGDDVLSGGMNDDQLIESVGNDVSNGGDHTDTLHVITDGTVVVNNTGGAGTIISNLGNDTFDLIENITTGASDDTYTLGGGGGSNFPFSSVMNAGSGSTTFNFLNGISGYWTVGGTGTETLDFSNLGAGVNVNLNNTATHQDVYGTGTFFLMLQGVFENVFGTNSVDTITGNVVDNTIVGNGGDDTISGGDGVDTLNGGDGNDMVNGDAGNDIVNGDGGNDTLNGGIGNDMLDGGAGNDVVNGDAGDDTLQLSAGNDTLNGGANTDTVIGTANADNFQINATNAGTVNTSTFTNTENLNGAAGNDRFVLTNNFETIDGTLNGGAGSDTFDLTTTGVKTMSMFRLTGVDEGFNMPYAGTRVTDFTSMENLIGDTTTDHFVLDDAGAVTGSIDGGDISPDVISYVTRTTDVTVNLATGTATDVALMTSIDHAYGGAGNDTLTGSNAQNFLAGGAGCDTLDGGAGIDTVYGGWINNNNYTNWHSINRDDSCGDTINDNDAINDTFFGGNQNVGGNGNDNGNDTFNLNAAGGLTTAYGGNYNYNNGSTGHDNGQDTFNVGTNVNGTLHGGNYNGFNFGGAPLGNDGNDIFILAADSGAVTVYGGNENLFGTGTDDSDTIIDNNNVGNTLYGGNDNNNSVVVCVGGANCADTGNDTITDNSSGFDSIYGGNHNRNGAIAHDTGNDTITLIQGTLGVGYGGNLNEGTGSSGNDTGNDALSVEGSTVVTLYGGNLNNNGGVGQDTGSDTLTDNSTGVNNIHGGNGNYSSACDTTNNCSDGNDTMIDNAGGNPDTFWGGNHNFNAGSVGNDGNDTITLNAGSNTNIVYGGNWSQSGVGTDGSDVIIDNNATTTTLVGGNQTNPSCTATTCADGADTITDGAPADANIIAGGNTGVGNDGADVINTADGDFADTVRADNGDGTGSGGATIIADSATPGNQ